MQIRPLFPSSHAPMLCYAMLCYAALCNNEFFPFLSRAKKQNETTVTVTTAIVRRSKVKSHHVRLFCLLGEQGLGQASLRMGRDADRGP
jgi:hypothetical protein